MPPLDTAGAEVAFGAQPACPEDSPHGPRRDRTCDPLIKRCHRAREWRAPVCTLSGTFPPLSLGILAHHTGASEPSAYASASQDTPRFASSLQAKSREIGAGRASSAVGANVGCGTVAVETQLAVANLPTLALGPQLAAAETVQVQVKTVCPASSPVLLARR
jgi:hypothetical protein